MVLYRASMSSLRIASRNNESQRKIPLLGNPTLNSQININTGMLQ